MINKKILITALIIIGVLVAAAMLASTQENKNESPQPLPINQAKVVKKVIDIEGMTCESCEATVERAGNKVGGLVSIKASSDEKRAIVEFDASQTSVSQIMQAINATGYKALGEHDSENINEVNTSVQNKVEAPAAENKCGAEKCGGSGKCGAAK